MGVTPTISAVMVSCNEADVIEPCLQSVARWVDEMVVVDMHSTDGTREIAQRYGARLVDHGRLPFAGPARNFAVEQTTGEWVLMLDPDERIPEKLALELRRLARDGGVDVVVVPYQSIVFGRSARSPGLSDRGHPRFFRRGTVSWSSYVHGDPDLTGVRCHLIPAVDDDMAIRHESWRSVSGLVDRIVRYPPSEVQELRAGGCEFSVGGMFYAAGLDFASRFVFGRAYEDGVPGLLAAIYSAIYWLTVYAELWEAEGRSARHDTGIMKWGRRIAPTVVFLRGAFRLIRRLAQVLRAAVRVPLVCWRS